MSALKALVLSLFVTLAVSGCGGGDQDDKELTSFDGPGFSVLLPGEVTQDTQTAPSAAGPLEVMFFSSESDDGAIAVSVTELPAGTPFDLDGAIQGVASGTGGTMQETETIQIAGVEGRSGRFTGEKSGQKFTGFTRVFVAEGSLYQIQQIIEGDDVDPPESFGKIVDSFKLG